MINDSILEAIDAEIAKLTQIRSMLSAGGSSNGSKPYTGARRGRKPGVSINASTATSSRGRSLSPEGRKRIADAMKKRWAEKRSVVKAVKSATPTKRVIGKPAVKNAVK
jgi:hypothetical protein